MNYENIDIFIFYVVNFYIIIFIAIGLALLIHFFIDWRLFLNSTTKNTVKKQLKRK